MKNLLTLILLCTCPLSVFAQIGIYEDDLMAQAEDKTFGITVYEDNLMIKAVYEDNLLSAAIYEDNLLSATIYEDNLLRGYGIYEDDLLQTAETVDVSKTRSIFDAKGTEIGYFAAISTGSRASIIDWVFIDLRANAGNNELVSSFVDAIWSEAKAKFPRITQNQAIIDWVLIELAPHR